MKQMKDVEFREMRVKGKYSDLLILTVHLYFWYKLFYHYEVFLYNWFWNDHFFSENERRVDEDLRDIKQIKDELREKRITVNELEVFIYGIRSWASVSNNSKFAFLQRRQSGIKIEHIWALTLWLWNDELEISN